MRSGKRRGKGARKFIAAEMATAFAVGGGDRRVSDGKTHG